LFAPRQPVCARSSGALTGENAIDWRTGRNNASCGAAACAIFYDDYTFVLDDGRLERWPLFFTEDCR